MPKKYGTKEKDQVISHIVSLILTGKLRTGDRLDRNEIAEQVGLSRAPVQEAVFQLEHDGVLTTRYHRGAYVERFDRDTLLEHHELYGVLNGIASARAATRPTPDLLNQLDAHLEALEAGRDSRAFHQTALKYRRTVNDGYAGPRLRAAIRASTTFMPRTFWHTHAGNHDDLIAFYRAETGAIHAGDPEAARAACVGRADVMGRTMLAELVRRRVLDPPATDTTPPVAL
ncbi:MAG: GntR family transcriptional regulator [Mycobacterium sp.]